MTERLQHPSSGQQEIVKQPLLKSALAVSRRLLKLYPWSLCIAVALILFSGLLDGIGLVALLPLLDLLTGQVTEASRVTQFFAEAFTYVGLPMNILAIVGVLIGVVAIKAALMYCAEVFVGGTVARLTSDFRLRLIRGLTKVRWPYFTSEPIGKVSNAITFEPVASAAAARGLMDFVSVSIQSIVYLGVALLLSWKLTLAGVLAGGIMAGILNLFVRISRREGDRQSKLMRSYTSRIVDWLNGIKAIKAMGLEGRIRPFLERETLELRSVQTRLVYAHSGLSKLQEPIAAIFAGIGLIIAIEVLSVPTNSLLVMVAVFLRAIGRIGAMQKSIKKFASNEAIYYAYEGGVAVVESQAEALDRSPDNGRAVPVQLEQGIEFKRVSYAHDPVPVLNGIDLTIEAGGLTALVGPSGAGKSTMIDILACLLKPDSGVVLVDGIDLNDFAVQDWRRTIGYVPQDTMLLHTTVRENITLGDAEISEDDIAWALAAADAGDFVAALPRGLDSVVGERGLKVSGGQRQRLAIARALVRRPRLLLLDEATSALDACSEQALCAQLAGLRPKLTIVAITHRPAIEAVADTTYHLVEGRITDVRRTALEQASNLSRAEAT